MKSPPWRDASVLIAGCGSIGRRHARVLRSLGVRDIRICDPSEDQRRALAAETSVTGESASLEEGLGAEPDAVFICTPPKLHIPMAVQALETGCHVFSEKPLSDSLEGIDELASSIQRSGKSFMVGFCFRYHEGLTKAKSYLDEGRIGRLVSIRCRMGEHLPEVRPDYRSLFTSKYSGAFDLTHEVDLACWFAGELPVSGVLALSGVCSDIGISAPDLVEILVQFGDRCLASIHLDFFSIPRRRLTELMGTKGTVSVEFASWNECTVSLYDADERAWAVEKLDTERDFMFRSEDREFLEAIARGTPVRLTLDEARKSLAVVCAAQAASSGRCPPACRTSASSVEPQTGTAQ